MLGQPTCGDYYFHNLTTVDGLSQNSVSMVMQDRQGFVWVATQNGVDKYIGSSFIPALGYDKSLFEKITYLFDWNKDYILVCTDQRNLLIHKWQPDEKKAIKLSSSIDSIVFIARTGSNDEKKQLLAFTTKGIYHLDSRLNRTEMVLDMGIQEILTVLPNPKAVGQFFIGTSEGVQQFDLNKRNLTPIWDKTKEIRALFLHTDGQLYFGGKTNGYIYRLDLTKPNINTNPSFILFCGGENLVDATITSLLVDKEGTIWVGTKKAGLHLGKWGPSEKWENVCRFQASRNLHEDDYFSSDYINCIHQSDDGVVWIGVAEGGLNLWQSEKPVFRHLLVSEMDYFTDELYQSHVWSIYGDQSDTLLLGLKDGGIAVASKKQRKALYRLTSAGDKGNNVFVIKPMGHKGDRLLIGTNGSILYSLKKSELNNAKEYQPYEKKVSIGNPITNLEYLHSLKKWLVGSKRDSTFYIYNRDFSKSPESIRFPNANEKFRFAKEMDGLIVVGSSEGLYKFNPKSNQLDAAFFKISDKFKAHFTCAERNGDGLWIGTDRKGLFLFSAKNGKLLWQETTLQDETIYDFLTDKKGNLWFSTNHGIYSYNLKTRSYNRYGVKDGLKVYEFNSGAALKTDDVFFFGGINGLEFFKPNRVELSKVKRHRPVLQYSFSNAEGKKTKTIDFGSFAENNFSINLPHKFGYLDIEPMLGHYQDPSNNDFILVLDNDTLKREEYGHYLLTEDNLKQRWWFWKRYKLEVAYRGGNSDWVSLKNPVFIQRGYNWPLTTAIFFACFSLISLYSAFRNSKKLQLVHKSINEVSQLTTTDEICKMALKHLTKDLGYEYAAISLVDFEERYIRTKYVKDEKLPTDLRNFWKEKSQYPFEHGDLLARVRDTKEFVVVVWNRIISNSSIHDSPELFKHEIYEPLGQKEMARVFVPMIYRGTVPAAEGQKTEETIMGVIEVGFRMNPLNKWLLRPTRWKLAPAYRRVNIVGFLESKQIQLEVYIDNLAQPYYSSYVKEKKREVYAFVEKLEKENPELGYDEFLKHSLGAVAKRLGAEYGNIALTSFNDEKIGTIRPEHLFGHTLELVEKYKPQLEPKNKGKIGIIKHVAERKMPYSSGDVEHDDYYRNYIPNVNSELALPMLVNENAPLVGVFNLMARKKDFFSQAIMEVYGRAIRKITDIYLQKKQFQTLLRISNVTDNFSISENELYRSMAQALGEYFKSEYTSVWIRRNPEATNYYLSEYATIPAFFKLYEESVFIEAQTVLDPSIENPENLVSIESPYEGGGNRISKFCTRYGFKGYITLRVVVDNKYQAFINVFSKREINREEIRGYSETFLNSVARKASSAIMNSRLINAIQAISSTLVDREKLNPLQAIVDKAYSLTPSADSVVLFPYREIGEIIKIKDAIIGGQLPPIHDIENPNKKATLANYILEHGSQYIDTEEKMANIAKESLRGKDTRKTFWKARGLKAVAAIRLEFEGRPVGVMMFNYKEQKNFEEKKNNTRQFIEAFANFATIALLSEDYIRRIQEEGKKISEELQQLGERQMAMKREAEKLKKDKEGIQVHYNDLNNLLEEMLPRAAGASFFLVLQGINHDIRNMLLELQADLDEFGVNLPEKFQEPIKAMGIQVEESAMKITNLMRLFNPNEQNTKESFSINEVIDQVLFFFKKNEASHIKFKTDFSSALPYLVCNKTEFSMIIYNLVKNAIQAIPKNKQGEITVRTQLEKKKYCISIQDNGEGIDNNILQKIYDLSFTTKTGGTGIGLYFVRETIMHKLEGQIRVFSYKGKGTTFFIEIPELVNYKN